MDYDLTVDLLRTEGASDAGLIVRSTGEDRNLRFGVSGKGGWKYCFLEASEGGRSRILKSVPYSILSGAWCTARVSVRGNHVTCSLHNGDRYVVLLDVDDELHPKGRVGLRTWFSAWRFKNIRVTAPDGKVLWEGPPAVTGPAATPPTRTAETTPSSPAPPEVRGGAWKVEGDERQSSLARGATLLFGEPWWSSYDFKFRAMSTGGTHGFKAKFHARDRGNACEFALGNYFNKYHDVSFESGGRWGAPTRCSGRATSNPPVVRRPDRSPGGRVPLLPGQSAPLPGPVRPLHGRPGRPRDLGQHREVPRHRGHRAERQGPLAGPARAPRGPAIRGDRAPGSDRPRPGGIGLGREPDLPQGDVRRGHRDVRALHHQAGTGTSSSATSSTTANGRNRRGGRGGSQAGRRSRGGRGRGILKMVS